MANAGPNTNGSQFFIVHGNLQKPQKDYLDKNHAIFGQTYEGMDILDFIANVKVNRDDKPLTDVVILSMKIEEIK